MTDVVEKATRSRMMAAIRSRNTKPERVVRSALHRRGFRFTTHPTKLPGKPDIVLPAYRAAIFVHGCFWHGHGCKYFKWPLTNSTFWRNKIDGNFARDARTLQALRSTGWRVRVIWECITRDEKALIRKIDALERWLRGLRETKRRNDVSSR